MLASSFYRAETDVTPASIPHARMAHLDKEPPMVAEIAACDPARGEEYTNLENPAGRGESNAGGVKVTDSSCPQRAFCPDDARGGRGATCAPSDGLSPVSGEGGRLGRFSRSAGC